MIDFKSFLIGYTYAISCLYHNKFNDNEYKSIIIDNQSNTFDLFTNNNEKIKIAINRGFSAIGGNVTLAFDKLDESHFDIAKNWVSENIWKHLEKSEGCDGHMECRLSFKELEKLIFENKGLNVKLMSEKLIRKYK